MSERYIQDRADEIVTSYVERSWLKARGEVYKEQHGNGCGCLTCKKHKVNELNSWTEFVANGCELNPVYHFGINSRGQIYQGDDQQLPPLQEDRT